MVRYFFIFLWIPFLLLAENRILDLQDFGKVVYHFEKGFCQKIVRIATSGEIKYEHHYFYDENNTIVSEKLIGNCGFIRFPKMIDKHHFIIHTPFGDEEWFENDSCFFEESKLKKIYDENGNLIEKGDFRYFYENRNLILIETPNYSVFYNYDKEGRRVSKKTFHKDFEEEEFYLFIDRNEIGSVDGNGELKWLRIPGITTHPDLVRAIAIETKDTVYAPIYDVRWNIVKLVNIQNSEVIETRPDPFGHDIKTLSDCPWVFCSKRYDKETGLVHFGYRDYDPELREWTTPDPLMQDRLTYRFCFNNPMKYLDPDGRAGFILPIIRWTGAVLSFPFWGPEAAAIAAGAAIGYLGYQGYKKYQNWVGLNQEDPPYSWDDLGWDPEKSPGEEFIWKGKGPPSSGRGNWFNPKTGEKLHPDLSHPLPKGPHWGYTDPYGTSYDIYPEPREE